MVTNEEFGITEYCFSIDGHRRRYNLTTLLHMFGERFCRDFEAAWRSAATLKSGDTAQAYFKKLRLLFQGLAIAGLAGDDEIASRVFLDLQNGSTPSPKDWQHVINEFLRLMGDVDNHSLTRSTNRRVRDKYVEAARGALNWLVGVRYLPPVHMRQRTASKFGTEAGADSLASLLYEAGRLDFTNMTELQASNEYIAANGKALSELRRCYVEEFQSEYRLFQKGKSILSKKSILSIDDFEDFLVSIPTERFEYPNFCSEIDLSYDELFSSTLMYYKDVFHNSRHIKIGIKKFQKLVALAGGHTYLQGLIESTSKSLNAAFHIVLIDTGLNAQPVKDLAEDPYVGTSKRGKRHIATIAQKKNRAGGKIVKGRLREDEVGELSPKGKGEVSGIRVIEMFREMSSPMRPADGPLAERLWINRRPGEYTVRHNLGQLDREWHYGFLDRHKDNPLFGGLCVTKRVIRRSFQNAKTADGSFDVNLAKAIAGQSTPAIAYHYLDSRGVKAILQEMIRKFLNAWEAVSASSLDDAAEKLGVNSLEFDRRKELGLENGLHFALFGNQVETNRSDEPNSEVLLADFALNFTVRSNTMRNLYLAKISINNHMEKIIHTNPNRFIRRWIPFLAIVEGYIFKIQQSRFASEFSKVQSELESGISSGDVFVPVIW